MIALVDCNNFFASCERLFRPDLASKPVLVLSNNDGCVVARSNEVKALGIPMGAPYFMVKDIIAKHNVTLFSSNFPLYSNISQRILNVLETVSPHLEVYSIDEAFLELSELRITDYEEWGRGLRERVLKNIGMPVSVGVAPTKTLAKLASEWAKQHGGVCVLDGVQDRVKYEEILRATEVSDIWGVGRQTARKLIAAGIHNTGQLLGVSQDWLHGVMGVNGVRLHAELSGTRAYGLEDGKKPPKSVIASRSFGRSTTSIHQLESAVATFAAQASARLRKFNQVTEVFGVYLRYADEDNRTKHSALSMRMLPASNNTSELTIAALQLLEKQYVEGVRYKKAGVFAYHLSSAEAYQSSLFETKSEDRRQKDKNLMRTIDMLNARFGKDTINLATVNPALRQWHAKKELLSPAYTTSWSQLPKVVA